MLFTSMGQSVRERAVNHARITDTSLAARDDDCRRAPRILVRVGRSDMPIRALALARGRTHQTPLPSRPSPRSPYATGPDLALATCRA